MIHHLAFPSSQVGKHEGYPGFESHPFAQLGGDEIDRIVVGAGIKDP